MIFGIGIVYFFITGEGYTKFCWCNAGI